MVYMVLGGNHNLIDAMSEKKQCICDSSASLQDATKCEFHFALSEVLEGGAVSPQGPDEMNRTSKQQKRGGMIPASWWWMRRFCKT